MENMGDKVRWEIWETKEGGKDRTQSKMGNMGETIRWKRWETM